MGCVREVGRPLGPIGTSLTVRTTSLRPGQLRYVAAAPGASGQVSLHRRETQLGGPGPFSCVMAEDPREAHVVDTMCSQRCHTSQNTCATMTLSNNLVGPWGGDCKNSAKVARTGPVRFPWCMCACPRVDPKPRQARFVVSLVLTPPIPKTDTPRGRRVVAAAGAEGVGDVGVVFLSGGVGKRMGAGMPKQYIKLLGREIALHALEAFLDCDVKEIVIVCAEEWRSVFEGYLAKRGTVKPVIKYTSGGKERQDSVKNGLDKLTTEFAAVHDCARPLVTKAEIDLVIADARRHGAALLAVRTKATIKRASDGKGDEAMVGDTLDRNQMWEAQTPQVVRCSLLRQGFDHAAKHGLAVTDDVSLVESLGKPVKLSEGEYTNIKVTTPEDISVAETILRSRGYEAPASV